MLSTYHTISWPFLLVLMPAHNLKPNFTVTDLWLEQAQWKLNLANTKWRGEDWMSCDSWGVVGQVWRCFCCSLISPHCFSLFLPLELLPSFSVFLSPPPLSVSFFSYPSTFLCCHPLTATLPSRYYGNSLSPLPFLCTYITYILFLGSEWQTGVPKRQDILGRPVCESGS